MIKKIRIAICCVAAMALTAAVAGAAKKPPASAPSITATCGGGCSIQAGDFVTISGTGWKANSIVTVDFSPGGDVIAATAKVLPDGSFGITAQASSWGPLTSGSINVTATTSGHLIPVTQDAFTVNP